MPALIMASFAVRAGAQVTEIKTPIVKGYYADPTIVKYKGTFYKYATIDPWGGEELGVLETKDFKKFTVDHINWPTKKACTSPTSNGSMVWAPSIRKAPNGKFYLYVAVGSEVWAGVSEDHGLGCGFPHAPLPGV
jgi:beta-xylosidase